MTPPPPPPPPTPVDYIHMIMMLAGLAHSDSGRILTKSTNNKYLFLMTSRETRQTYTGIHNAKRALASIC